MLKILIHTIILLSIVKVNAGEISLNEYNATGSFIVKKDIFLKAGHWETEKIGIKLKNKIMGKNEFEAYCKIYEYETTDKKIKKGAKLTISQGNFGLTIKHEKSRLEFTINCGFYSAQNSLWENISVFDHTMFSGVLSEYLDMSEVKQIKAIELD